MLTDRRRTLTTVASSIGAWRHYHSLRLQLQALHTIALGLLLEANHLSLSFLFGGYADLQ